ncbi:MAG TPA: biotin carboxylase N-terminal domain-containing protein [Actinomycetota bacterium]|nr:biotin carboxylase N-terminal domain-containing protein [Actinomycetota bacterium]
MTTLLVANRGEIAMRIFRTARAMGMRCVAVYSEADKDAPFVKAADVAIQVGPAPAADSYLRTDKIIAAAIEAGADLLHPGYGFLAEDPELAEACTKSGIRFVGPPAEVLRAMGAKDEAKSIATAAGVPVLAGYSGDDQSDEAFIAAIDAVGLPVIVKPVAGGGGKGMAVITSKDQIAGALATARRVGAAAFGDERLLIERYVSLPRHVEVQVIADDYGSVLHLWERDCSLQRRHQKILEETPSPAIDEDLRKRLTDAAVALARHVGYRNAGTCEFIVGDGEFAFLEMNTRLQVEHPVTEMVTGLDLVALQLDVALGNRLPLVQNDIKTTGHAIEVRLYAEDPDAGFLPQGGEVLHLAWPPNARIDMGIEQGSVVTTNYDPMLAKVIVHGANRSEALTAMREALDATEVLGVKTNIAFLRSVIETPEVTAGNVTTDWLESTSLMATLGETPEEVFVIAAAAQAERLLNSADRGDPWSSLGPWRTGSAAGIEVAINGPGAERFLKVTGEGPFEVEGRSAVKASDSTNHWMVGETRAATVFSEERWHVWWDGRSYEVPIGVRERVVGQEGTAHVQAPMPGSVLAVKVASGDKVVKGQELVVVEAMKMEHAVTAPSDGVVRAVLCAPGDQVERGKTLVDFEAS